MRVGAHARSALDSIGKFGITNDLEVVDIRQHPDAQRFVAAFHQALVLELSVKDADRVKARIDSLLVELCGK